MYIWNLKDNFKECFQSKEKVCVVCFIEWQKAFDLVNWKKTLMEIGKVKVRLDHAATNTAKV